MSFYSNNRFLLHSLSFLLSLLQIPPVEDLKNLAINVIQHGNVVSHTQYVIKTLENVNVTIGFQQQIISISVENVSIIGKSLFLSLARKMSR